MTFLSGFCKICSFCQNIARFTFFMIVLRSLARLCSKSSLKAFDSFMPLVILKSGAAVALPSLESGVWSNRSVSAKQVLGPATGGVRSVNLGGLSFTGVFCLSAGRSCGLVSVFRGVNPRNIGFLSSLLVDAWESDGFLCVVAFGSASSGVALVLVCCIHSLVVFCSFASLLLEFG